MGFKGTLNPATDKYSPLQADPKVQPSFSKLFLCSTWPSHEYSARDKCKTDIKTSHLYLTLCESVCVMKFSGLIKYRNAADQFTKRE
jgi:hypothetical protein